jgi:hypothetical protein
VGQRGRGGRGQVVLRLRDRDGASRATGLRLRARLATDERPFFFNQLPLYDPLRTIQSALHPNSDGVNRGNILATATLALLFLLSTMLALATIIMPLRPAIRDIGRRLAFGGTMYFLLIGIGFTCVEIGLLQRLSVFLGHPIYSLSIVLFSIILATGVGSLLSDRLPLDTPTKFVTWSVLSAAISSICPIGCRTWPSPSTARYCWSGL